MTPKRSQKRLKLVGTRKLSKRSLRTAFNESRPIGNEGYPLRRDGWLHERAHTPEKWPAIEAYGREVEQHVIVHQMRQVYALAARLLGKTAAAKLARHWTMKEP